MKPIDLETPCFYIDIRWVAKDFYEKYGEDSKRTHFSCVAWYVDGPFSEAQFSFDQYVKAAIARGDVIVKAVISPVTGYFLKRHREPVRRSLVSDPDWRSY